MSHIDSNSTICGYPALEIRKAFRTANVRDMCDVDLAQLMKLPLPEAISLRERLILGGFWQEASSSRGRWTAYANTSMATRIANANALRPIGRGTADRLVAGLVDRMTKLETHTEFVFRVKEAVVFGSYARGAETVSDIDIGYALQGRAGSKEADFAALKARIETVRQFRAFKGLLDEYMTPENEVLVFLRKRSGYLSFHRIDREGEAEIVASGNPVRIYPAESPRAE